LSNITLRIRIVLGLPRIRAGLTAVTLAVALISNSGAAHAQAATSNPSNWVGYGGNNDSQQYSSLNQVNKDNVRGLELVWFFPAPTEGGRFNFNPTIVDGTMYVLGSDNSIVALDAETGEELWNIPHDSRTTNRGINYWESSDRSDRRLFYASSDLLRAIDAGTGETIESFGEFGMVNLKEGLGRDPATVSRIQSSTPGRIYRDLIIMGSATGEDYGSPPGDIRAYNVVTGELQWSFRTIPQPGEFGYDTWPEGAWEYAGGVNSWGGMTVDEERGIVYVPTGSPTYDFYGADRRGDNLFSDSLLALNANTGERLWHFQFIHHDLWDFDTVTSPKLITVDHDGKQIDAVSQTTKQGFLYVFDRVTGEPLWPIEERPVPKSHMPGEHASPTQPFPTKPPPFARQDFTVAEVNPFITDPQELARIKAWVGNARNEGLFTPPGLSDTIQMPGNNGGGNWGGTAANSAAGLVFVMSKDAPTMLRMEPQRPRGGFNAPPELRGAGFYEDNCQGCHGIDLLGHAGMGPALVDSDQRLGAAKVSEIITNGQNGMPGYAASALNSSNIQDIVAFLANPKAADVPVRQRGGNNTPGAEGPDSPVAQKYFTGYGTMSASNSMPAIGPPWSTLTAYDLNLGTIKWQVPLGTVQSLAEQGFTNTGSYWPHGGPVVTAGGLVFAGSKGDRFARAYDEDTGAVLWEEQLPSGPDGIPSVYAVEGRQYIVFPTKSSRVSDNLPENPDQVVQALGAPEAQGYYVFALPIE